MPARQATLPSFLRSAFSTPVRAAQKRTSVKSVFWEIPKRGLGIRSLRKSGLYVPLLLKTYKHAGVDIHFGSLVQKYTGLLEFYKTQGVLLDRFYSSIDGARF